MTNRIPLRDGAGLPTRELPPMAEYNDEVSESVLAKLRALTVDLRDDDFEDVEPAAWPCNDVGE